MQMEIKMLVISILEAEDFEEELYSIMRKNIMAIIKQQHVGLVIAAGDTKGMIYRLLNEFSDEYPHIFFTILLSNDKLAYDKNPIFSLDCNIAYDDPINAKQKRRETIIQHSDVVFCRRKYCNEIRRINRHCDIMVL